MLKDRNRESPKKPAKSGAPAWVYAFGGGAADGDAGMRELLGGKGANLAEMASLGLPVPPGFTITTEVCSAYFDAGGELPEALKPEVEAALARVGEIAGARFGDPDNPLLVSVRSGSQASMPGMMDTVLNLGLNDETCQALAVRSGDERFAFDSYRRFIQMYGDVVLGADHHLFEDVLANFKNVNGFALDTELGAEHWREVIEAYKALIEEEVGEPFPQDIYSQLWGAIRAVFASWQNARAITYRHLHQIPDDWGTAVTIQAMVFGNRGETSVTGVAFTRNPSTGEKAVFGEFLVNAQGEDVVAGIRTPQSLTEAARRETGDQNPSLEALMPKVFSELAAVYDKLEARYRDMQDIEFTVQEGKLWILQTRAGKRTVKSALRIAVEMAEQGLITQEDALLRLDAGELNRLLHPTLDPDAEKQVIATGLPASPGAASGAIVFDPNEAESLGSKGRSVILVRVETSPEDIHGMHAAAGILTSRGGMTSHAAVVARGMGRPCISGAGGARIDYEAETLSAEGVVLKKGDILTIDGSSGQVLKGEVAMRQPELTSEFAKLMAWADARRRLRVRANADTPRDARQAREFDAEGIGLCRTEHMFFEPERIRAVREMILADTQEARRLALEKILPMQRADFIELFEIMDGRPVTIRLLDPPLHEFLPHQDEEIAEVAEVLEVSTEKLRSRIAGLKEFNPMLGHRGCRLAISYPEITEVQARAIFEAAVEVSQASGKPVVPEVMIPLVATRAEFDILKVHIDSVAELVRNEKGVRLDYEVGTMIELPRACLRAGEIAASAEFFSFGTNDLTQTTLGLSRDDSASFLGEYTRQGIFEEDPFVTLDQEGVGELLAIAVERGRNARKGLKLGICGEHAGDPKSIEFCDSIGLDYVSCSPYRVPVARLAAAQSALRAKGKKC
jgi:pyruvate,orthophosphate dikinase